MLTFKGTQGPWEFEAGDAGSFEIFIDPNDIGCYMVIAARGPHEKRAEEMRANARLIAAAPDLLEALMTFVFPYQEGCRLSETERQEKARAAIRKATGEAQ